MMLQSLVVRSPTGNIAACMALISVVVPIYNEQENLPELRRRMTAALDTTGDQWELILVNDGSRDASPQMLQQMHQDKPRIKEIFLSRNFAHQPAGTAQKPTPRGHNNVPTSRKLQ